MTEFTYKSVSDAVTNGRLITRGPLNDTYSIMIKDRRFFVRVRTLANVEYGQSFAAERYLQATLHKLEIPSPALLAVVGDLSGQERFAVFAHLEASEPDWSSPRTFDLLANLLARLHSVKATVLGDIGGPYCRSSVGAFIGRLIAKECHAVTNLQTRLSLELVVDECNQVFADATPSLVHGDIHRGNIMVDRRGILWLVDWEAARFRSAASDFNQLLFEWLAPEDERRILGSYLRLTALDGQTFEQQVRVLRLLWHLRTFNFYTKVLDRPIKTESAHLHEALRLAQLLTTAT